MHMSAEALDPPGAGTVDACELPGTQCKERSPILCRRNMLSQWLSCHAGPPLSFLRFYLLILLWDFSLLQSASPFSLVDNIYLLNL